VTDSAHPLVKVAGVRMHFPITTGVFVREHRLIRAVDGVDLELGHGETLGLVGESGCGKSTLARVIIQLYQPTEGRVWLDGTELTNAPPAVLREQRRHMQMIFQDPYASLNPRMTVGNIVAEPLYNYGVGTPAERREEVAHLLNVVGLDPRFIRRYPHEFSGGQRQRIGIARALALKPRVMICDEPISALDVSIQAQVMNLLQELQAQFNLSYLFIAHDLAVVRHISDRIAVMYLGRIVEVADRDTIYRNPLHPYTRALLSAVPIPDPVVEAKRQQILLEGDVPSPDKEYPGCRFASRCPLAEERCLTDDPEFREVEAPDGTPHKVACHLVDSTSGTPVLNRADELIASADHGLGA
jgi:oligopeptide transport system ATP-binding protein